ncbi:MAG: YbaB/EbfC family nucleoid-associated protein, partial [Deltaproteobacteria bacterium]
SRMQRKMEDAKAKFKETTFEVAGANDKIKVVSNGAREVVSIAIDPEFLKGEDIGMVQDALVGVVNAALAKANEQLEAHMDTVTGGVKIPGMV